MCEITKETFVEVIKKLQEDDKFVNKLAEYIRLEKFDGLFYASEIADIFFVELFGPEITDKINEWFYEDDGFTASVEEIEEFYNELFC